MNYLLNLPAPRVALCVRTLAQYAGPFYRPALLTALLLCSWLTSKAQDLVLKKDKTRIEATIVEITEDAVQYKRFDFQDGPLYNIKKSEVFMIVYKNGLTESFDPPAPVSAAPAPRPTRSATPAQMITKLVTPPAISPAPQPAVADEPRDVTANTFMKNPMRLMAGAGLAKSSGSALTFMGALEIMGANKKIGFLSNFTNAGMGLAVNSVLDLSGYADDISSEYLVYSKHYLSLYAFKEFDGRLGALGLLLGPSFNYTHATYYDYADSSKQGVDISTGFITAGLQTGQYVQKPLWKNGKGEKTGYLRLGINQFFMLEGSSGSTLVISVII